MKEKNLITLAQQKRIFSYSLSLAMMFIYFGFILLVAYNKQLMGSLIVPGLSWGILLGALVIVSVWILIYIYVRWTNNYYDRNIKRIMQGEK